MNFFSRLQQGLSKTRVRILETFGDTVRFDESFFDSVEDALVQADIGLDLSLDLVSRLRVEIEQGGIRSAPEAYECLKSMIARDISLPRDIDDFPPKPWVTLVVGVNGVGKTTTIGKLASALRSSGKSVLLGAADTFRAGAIEQLSIWAQRTGSGFVAQQEGADPASVAFDALQAARARGVDVCILDTAGRLHNKVNLMNELEKMVRVLKRSSPHAPNEILLVIDATTGQNALKQASVFHERLGITGLIITKLDGTAKGGIALALTKILGIPVKKIGVGEGIDDLQDFSPREYVEAMFGGISKP